MSAVSKRTQDELIAHYIRPNPYRAEIADAVVTDEGVPVWALIGAVTISGATPEDVARDYEISPEAMSAVLAYHGCHRAVIDARIAANDVGNSGRTRASSRV